MTVLAIVQSWNEDDPVRGFTVGLVEELARHADHIAVLALEKRHEPRARNIAVHSLGKERSCPAFRYPLNWHSAMRSVFRDRRPDVIFTHMTPLYSVLAYPYAKYYGVPIVTWFLHPRGSIILHLAHFLSTRIVSASRDSYPYPDGKLVPIGHGIDTDFFAPDPARRVLPPLIVSAGRISPIKNCALLIEATAIVRQVHPAPFSVVFVGSPLAPDDRPYHAALGRRVAILGLQNIIRFVPSVSRERLREWYRQATLHANCTESGSGDKVILEAMACGTPSIAISPVFKESFGAYRDALLCPPDVASLARRIGDILAMPVPAHAVLSAAVRDGSVSHHSLPAFCRRLTNVFHASCSGQ